MDIYFSVVDYLVTNLPTLRDWSDADTLLKKAARMQPRDWRLPLLACEAVGGKAEQAIPACAALACTLIGIVLIDDMLDDDPRGEYHQLGMAQSANFASAFLTAGSHALLRSQVQPHIKLKALQSLNLMGMTIALGQHLDIQNPLDEAAYWRVVQTKSAPFFGTALEMGALFGNAPEEVIRKVERVGRFYGEMIQIYDDLNDTMSVPANPDWLQGRSPLPILFAKSVDHPERSRFLELLQDVSDENALREAQEILIHCGAVSYCVDQILRRHQAAQEILTTLLLPHRNVLDALLEEVVAPVQRLFEAIGESLPASSTSEGPGSVA